MKSKSFGSIFLYSNEWLVTVTKHGRMTNDMGAKDPEMPAGSAD